MKTKITNQQLKQQFGIAELQSMLKYQNFIASQSGFNFISNTLYPEEPKQANELYVDRYIIIRSYSQIVDRILTCDLLDRLDLVFSERHQEWRFRDKEAYIYLSDDGDVILDVVECSEKLVKLDDLIRSCENHGLTLRFKSSILL